MNRARRLIVLMLLLLLAPALAAPRGLFAQTAGSAQNVRARVGSSGGGASLANVRVVLPGASAGGRGVLALGVGLVPRPPALVGAAGDTGILISVSPPPRGPATFVIRPSESDLAAAGGEPARLALYDTTGERAYGCRADRQQLICAAPAVGLYLLVPAANAEFLVTAPVDGPPEQVRGPMALAVGSGAAVALLSTSLWLWRLRRPTGNIAETG